MNLLNGLTLLFGLALNELKGFVLFLKNCSFEDDDADLNGLLFVVAVLKGLLKAKGLDEAVVCDDCWKKVLDFYFVYLAALYFYSFSYI